MVLRILSSKLIMLVRIHRARGSIDCDSKGVSMRKTVISVFSMAMILLTISGCAKKNKEKIAQLEEAIQLNQNIGYFAEVFSSNAVLVEGYGIVMGLGKNGSAQCPVGIESQMVKLIQRKLNTTSRKEALDLLKSRDNAVVRVYGIIPTGSAKGTKFDVIVEALEGTQTTSLEGGTLFECNLVPYNRVGVAGARELATAKGAVYVENINGGSPNKTKGVVIGGAESIEEPVMTVALYEQNFMLTSLIRNMINDRFGSGTAIAKTPGLILINPPTEYSNRQEKFTKLIKALYLPQNDQTQIARIKELASQLGEKNQIFDSEIGLEAIGRRCIGYVREYLKSDNEYVRLRAARVLLDLGDDDAAWTLRDIALDKKSPYRVEAIEAIGYADRDIIQQTLRVFIDDEDIDVRIAAYRALKRIDDVSITTEQIGNEFTMEVIEAHQNNTIYIRRQKDPAIIVFGRDIKAIHNIFITSKDHKVTICATPNADKVSIIRKNPFKPGIIGPIKSGYSITSIIRALGESPSKKAFSFKQGLGVDFAEIVPILETMCKSGAVNAKFVAQPLADIDSEIKARLK